MITEAILELVFRFYKFIVDRIPSFDITLPVDIVGGLINIINGIAYIFPLGDFIVILGIYILIVNFHIIYNLLRSIRSFLPF